MNATSTAEPATAGARYRPPPIAGHRLLSDGRSTALLVPTGEIDWWCWPRMHSPALAWSLLDRDGGHASFMDASHVGMHDAPAGPTARTTLRVDGRVIEVWDGMMACGDASDLVRLVRCVDGPLEVTHGVRLGGFDAEPVEWSSGHLRLADGFQLWIHGGATTFGRDGTALTRLRAPERAWVALSLTAHERVHDLDEIITGFERSESEQRVALDQCNLPRTHSERAKHALAVLDACTDRVTGAVVASPTTSLPEVVGGDRQFDYRFAWLRDGAIAISVASLLGREEVMERFAGFLVQLGPEGILNAPLHDVDGLQVPEEHEVEGVDGWGRSRPIRTGNAAASQVQYDALGIVLDAMFVHAKRLRQLSSEGWTVVRTVADRACESLDEESNGIWELRTPGPLVSADIGRWLALDRAVRIARMTRPWARGKRRWRATRKQVRARVLDAIRPDGSLPHAYGADAVDASALLLVVFGLLKPGDPRAARLVDATVHRLGSGPLLYRYPPDGRDGFAPGEAPFVPASWWAVSALAILGRREAQLRADELCGMLPALLPEEFDPVREEALGNTPLVWSHAECARALFELDRQRGMRARLTRMVAGRSRSRSTHRRDAGLRPAEDGQESAAPDEPATAKEIVVSDEEEHDMLAPTERAR